MVTASLPDTLDEFKTGIATDGNLIFASEDIKVDFEKVMAEKIESAKADGKEMKEAADLVTGEIKVK